MYFYNLIKIWICSKNQDKYKSFQLQFNVQHTIIIYFRSEIEKHKVILAFTKYFTSFCLYWERQCHLFLRSIAYSTLATLEVRKFHCLPLGLPNHFYWNADIEFEKAVNVFKCGNPLVIGALNIPRLYHKYIMVIRKGCFET